MGAICLIATGGTIASLRDPATGGVRPSVGATELAASVPGLAELGLARVEEVANVSGWNVTPDLMLTVAGRAMEILADPAIDGVVVTHGTDTVEETAFVCDLLVSSEKPVVFAAAMRAGDEMSADGPRNLWTATKLAGLATARGLGCLLAMNDEVHAARWVRKLDSFRVSSFQSPDHGPVALVLPDGVRILRRPERVTMPTPASLSQPVPVVQVYTGMDEGLISAVVEHTRADAMVLEGTGLGNLPGSAMAELQALRAKGLPIVVASRTAHGGTNPVYGGPGGGASLRNIGVVGARSLTGAKARLLLKVLLGRGFSNRRILSEFAAITELLA